MEPSKKLIMVVEDDSWTRHAMVNLLRHKGWEVVASANVNQTLELLESSRPDCILLDLTLPDGSGEAILRYVRDAGLPSKVVICTSTHEASRLEGVLRLQPHALFVKPIELDDVLEACNAPPQPIRL